MSKTVPMTVGGDWFGCLGWVIFVALVVVATGFISIKMRQTEQQWVREEIRKAIEANRE